MRVGVKQRVSQGLSGREGCGRIPGQLFLGDQAADKRVAVRVNARGRQADDDVADRDVGPRQDLATFDGTDREACEVVICALVVARHLGSLAADKRASCLTATFADARDDGGRGCHVELSDSEIVEEEQRLGTLHDEVVDAHGHKVDADRTVSVGVDGDAQLGADAVVGGDQHRIAEAGPLKVE